MTREEAIYELKNAAWLGTDHSRARTEEAVDIAIQALSQEPKYRMAYDYADGKARKFAWIWGNGWTEIEQEPCDDNRLYIKVYADLEPQEKAEKLYQICEEEELLEVYKELGVYCDIEPCDDAISRKDIQDYIAKYLSQYLYEDVRQAVEVIDAYIGDMPSVTQKSGKWIPVGERLPEENGYYLTTTMYHEVYCDYWEEERFNRTEAVIAWIPLPKPYEPQESEDKE